jgi:NAD+ diphosphatase
VVQEHGQGVELIERDATELAALDPDPLLNLGTLEGKPCLACEIHVERALPAEWRAVDPRTLFGQLDELSYSLVGYARDLLNWQRHHRYCPNCGQLSESLPASWGRTCPHCGFTNYPTVTPAILVLVHDGGDKVLLVRKPGWTSHRSIIAGFVEPGESLEGCVKREIYEEVGLQVTDITYVGSQPWPYPDQLMAGFTARYIAGEIHLQTDELDAADWYEYDDLPGLPMQESLSYQIITQWSQSRQPVRK